MAQALAAVEEVEVLPSCLAAAVEAEAEEAEAQWRRPSLALEEAVEAAAVPASKRLCLALEEEVVEGVALQAVAAAALLQQHLPPMRAVHSNP